MKGGNGEEKDALWKGGEDGEYCKPKADEMSTVLSCAQAFAVMSNVTVW